MDYVAIDFEASCLPRHGRSFPIEVGIAGAFGARSWLIRPDPSWRDWTEEAFGLHGISRQQLNDEGIAPETVLAELRRAIAGKRVVADSMIDSQWWDTLVAVTPYHHASPIEHVSMVLDEWGATPDIISAACKEAERHCPARHRAADDACWLWTVLASAGEQLNAIIEAPSPWTPALAHRHAATPFRPIASPGPNPSFMS